MPRVLIRDIIRLGRISSSRMATGHKHPQVSTTWHSRHHNDMRYTIRCNISNTNINSVRRLNSNTICRRSSSDVRALVI